MVTMRGEGDPNFRLATSYLTGTGGTYDTARAYRMFHNGAVRGHRPSAVMCEILRAMANGVDCVDRFKVRCAVNEGIDSQESEWMLGKLYDLGILYDPDPDVMMAHYRRSAGQDSCLGQLEVWRRVPKDIHMLERAASMGYVDAILDLADDYRGRGDSESLDHAFELYVDGMLRGSQECAVKASWMRINGMDSGKLDLDLMSTLEPIAERGCVEAQCLLGHMHRYEEGVQRSDDKAGLWFLSASDGSSSYARCQLGIMHEFGIGVDGSSSLALHFYNGSSEGLARCRMAMMYERGIGVERSSAKAAGMYSESGFPVLAMYRLAIICSAGEAGLNPMDESRYLSEAANAGNPDAMYRLATMYRKHKKLRDQAFRLCYRATEYNHPEAEMLLASFYRYGIGTRRSKDDAIQWAERANMHGHPDAAGFAEDMRSRRFLF